MQGFDFSFFLQSKVSSNITYKSKEVYVYSAF